MRSTGYFVLGVLAGVIGALAVERALKARPEEADLLSKQVAEHLRQLENRLEAVIHPVPAEVG